MKTKLQLNKVEQILQQELQNIKEIRLGKFIVDQMSENNPHFTAIEWNRHSGYLKVFFNGNEDKGEMLKACVFLFRMLSFLQQSIQNKTILCLPIPWGKTKQLLPNSERFEQSIIDTSHSGMRLDLNKNRMNNYMPIIGFDLPKFIHNYACGTIKVQQK